MKVHHCIYCGLEETEIISKSNKHSYDEDNICYLCGHKRVIGAGDLNGDEKINSLDGLMLLRYLNGWNVEIASPEAMDINGDEKINSLDGLLLLRYLNNWDIELG